jgi:teichoic acid transport system permease protein
MNARMPSRLAQLGRRLLGSPGQGRLSAPGALLSAADAQAAGLILSPDIPGEPLADYASRHGLRPSAERPAVFRYIVMLWQRRTFIVAFATARNIAMYTEARLGQLWQILTPLLNAGVYFLIFGLLLKISKGIPNYLAFLVTGVFVFNFTQRSFITTSTVITDSLPLIRALQFPRAALPLAYVIIELQQMVLSMAVLAVIVLATGEPITWYWLLVIPALLLQAIFNVGMGLFVARLGSRVNDFSQLLPFLLRTWMYVSGVLFSIGTLTVSTTHRWIPTVLSINPAALYITLIRNAMLASQRLSNPGTKAYSKSLCHLWGTVGHHTGAPKRYLYDSAYCHPYASPEYFWYYAIGWAVLALVVGFIFFWRAEAQYGRG